MPTRSGSGPAVRAYEGALMVKQLDKDGDSRVDYAEFAAGVADRERPELLGALLVGRWLRVFYDDDADQVAGRAPSRPWHAHRATPPPGSPADGLWCTRWGR